MSKQSAEIARLNRRLGFAEGLIAALDIELLRYSHPTWPDNYYIEYWNRAIRTWIEPEMQIPPPHT